MRILQPVNRFSDGFEDWKELKVKKKHFLSS